MDALSILLALVCVAALVAVAMRIRGDVALVRYLRRAHPETWTALGAPGPWFTRLEDVQAVHRFLFGRADAALGDTALVGMCRRLRHWHVSSYALPVVALALALARRHFARA